MRQANRARKPLSLRRAESLIRCIVQARRPCAGHQRSASVVMTSAWKTSWRKKMSDTKRGGNAGFLRDAPPGLPMPSETSPTRPAAR